MSHATKNEHAENVRRRLESFGAAYALTAAEREVLGALLNGARPREIAEQRGVALSTVRTQLKRLYAKTDCRSQADLVRAVLQSPSR